MRHAHVSADRLAALALGAAPVAALGFADGGFFPRPWAWATLGLSCAAIVVVLARRTLEVSPRALVLLGLLVALGLWTAASLAWTRSVALSVPELQRLLVYLTGIGAAALLIRARTGRTLLMGIFLGTSGVVVWGLLSYLVTRERALDVFQGAYLHRPMGYANAMGIAAVLALLLGLGIVADSTSRLARMGAGVALVPLASALALTGSRASWVALLVGAGIAAGLVRDRESTIRSWGWALVVPTIAVLVVSAVDLPSSEIVGERADRLGERVLVTVVALTALAAVPSFLASRPARIRARSGLATRWLIAAAVLLLVAIAMAGATRLPSLGGERPTLWGVAVQEFRERPLLGSGAGTYAHTWLERRPISTTVRDAHSLLVETLSELGIVGVAIVLVLLGAPLVWGLRARAGPLVPAATGAFAAYAVHASLDWDWEMPAVTLAGLLCAVALGVAADGESRPLVGNAKARGVTLGLLPSAVGLAVVGLIGATAFEDASRALGRNDPAAAERAGQRAERWQPWSAEPLLLRGRASLALGDRHGARIFFARAAARDPNDYRSWLALAAVSDGDAADAALLRARALNPRSVRGS